MLVLCYDIKCLLGSEETLGFSWGRGEASPALAATLQASRSPDLTALHPATLHACPPVHAHTKMTANTQACRHTPAITHLHTQTHVHAHGHTGVCLHTLLCTQTLTHTSEAPEAPPLPIYPTNPSPPSAPAHPRAPSLSILPSPGTNPRARVLWVTALNHCVRITSGGRIRREEGEMAMKRSEFWVRSWNERQCEMGAANRVCRSAAGRAAT